MNEQTFTENDFQSRLAQHQLMGSRCRACGEQYLPPRPMCPACYGRDMEWVAFSGRGELAAFTAVHIAPTAMIEAGYGRDNPYVAGIVQLEEGPRISAQIVGVEGAGTQDLAVGRPLRVAFLARGKGDQQRTFLAFEPDISDQ